MATKRDRQNAILELVREIRIDSQQNLADALSRQGIEVSQATLSRDIQQLGLIKVGSVYRVGRTDARRTTQQALRRRLREYVIQVDSVEPLLVLKTETGSAPTVAEELDNANWLEIVGTIAGDDTVFVLCRSALDLHQIRERIENLLA